MKDILFTPLRDLNMKDLIFIVVLKSLGTVVVIVGGLAIVGGLGLLGEGVSRQKHSQCLKQATNGLEIERCR